MLDSILLECHKSYIKLSHSQAEHKKQHDVENYIQFFSIFHTNKYGILFRGGMANMRPSRKVFPAFGPLSYFNRGIYL